jgi:hypothetical protein
MRDMLLSLRTKIEARRQEEVIHRST